MQWLGKLTNALRSVRAALLLIAAIIGLLLSGLGRNEVTEADQHKPSKSLCKLLPLLSNQASSEPLNLKRFLDCE